MLLDPSLRLPTAGRFRMTYWGWKMLQKSLFNQNLFYLPMIARFVDDGRGWDIQSIPRLFWHNDRHILGAYFLGIVYRIFYHQL